MAKTLFKRQDFKDKLSAVPPIPYQKRWLKFVNEKVASKTYDPDSEKQDSIRFRDQFIKDLSAFSTK